MGMAREIAQKGGSVNEDKLSELLWIAEHANFQDDFQLRWVLYLPNTRPIEGTIDLVEVIASLCNEDQEAIQPSGETNE